MASSRIISSSRSAVYRIPMISAPCLQKCAGGRSGFRDRRLAVLRLARARQVKPLAKVPLDLAHEINAARAVTEAVQEPLEPATGIGSLLGEPLLGLPAFNLVH